MSMSIPSSSAASSTSKGLKGILWETEPSERRLRRRERGRAGIGTDREEVEALLQEEVGGLLQEEEKEEEKRVLSREL